MLLFCGLPFICGEHVIGSFKEKLVSYCIGSSRERGRMNPTMCRQEGSPMLTGMTALGGQRQGGCIVFIAFTGYQKLYSLSIHGYSLLVSSRLSFASRPRGELWTSRTILPS